MEEFDSTSAVPIIFTPTIFTTTSCDSFTKQPESTLNCESHSNNIPGVDSDISVYYNKSLTDDEKYRLLTETWVPEKNHIFPKHAECDKMRTFCNKVAG